jgi:hypothetical protein
MLQYHASANKVHQIRHAVQTGEYHVDDRDGNGWTVRSLCPVCHACQSHSIPLSFFSFLCSTKAKRAQSRVTRVRVPSRPNAVVGVPILQFRGLERTALNHGLQNHWLEWREISISVARVDPLHSQWWMHVTQKKTSIHIGMEDPICVSIVGHSFQNCGCMTKEKNTKHMRIT